MFIKAKLVLHYVAPTKQSDKGNSQDITFCEPAQSDRFGEKIGKDNFFELRAYNKDLLKLPDLMKIRSGTICEVEMYLASKEVTTKDGAIFYSPYLTLKGILPLNEMTGYKGTEITEAVEQQQPTKKRARVTGGANESNN